MKSILFVGLVVLAAVGFWLMPGGREDFVAAPQQAAVVPVVLATSGTHEGSAEVEGGVVLTEIETITGAIDGMTLVGSRVDLHVDVQQRVTDRAFWVGSPDNRVLVVLGRDSGDGENEPQRAETSGHRLSPVRGGQRAAISGVIRAMPAYEQRLQWNLTEADGKELANRKIYIRADRFSAEGHGHVPH